MRIDRVDAFLSRPSLQGLTDSGSPKIVSDSVLIQVTSMQYRYTRILLWVGNRTMLSRTGRMLTSTPLRILPPLPD